MIKSIDNQPPAIEAREVPGMHRYRAIPSESDEWGKWDCPVCGSEQEDPESFGGMKTECRNGHVVRLGWLENNNWGGIEVDELNKK